jgi:hypothetical protein
VSATAPKSRDPVSSPKKRGTRFVPLEDAPSPGMSQRMREVLALALCGFAIYALLCLATFRLADLDGPIPTAGVQNLGGRVGYYLALGFTRALGLAGWIPFVLLLLGAVLLFLGRHIERLTIKLLGTVMFAATMAILFAGVDGHSGVREITPYGAGGVFGAFACFVRLRRVGAKHDCQQRTSHCHPGYTADDIAWISHLCFNHPKDVKYDLGNAHQ